MNQIKNLRKSIKVSQQTLADALGVARSTVAMWETSGSQPDNFSLLKMAEYFNVSVDYILGRDVPLQKEKPANDNVDGYTDREQKLIQWLRSLPPEAREAVLRFPDISETSPNSQE